MISGYALSRVFHGGISVFCAFFCLLSMPCWGQSGTISGTVWYDSDADSIRDIGEPPLPGWPIHLQDGRETISRSDGSYLFTGLTPGRYTVMQASTTGWAQSFPQPSFSLPDQLAWAGSLAGTGSNTVMGNVLAAGPAGGFYTAGHFTGTVDLDPTGGEARYATNSTAGFVTLINRDGSYAWSWTASLGDGTVTGIATDAEGLYLVGYFTGRSVDFGTINQPDVQTNSGWRALFVTHLKSNGTYGWTRIISGESNSTVRGMDLCVDCNDGLYITGTFNKSVDFDSGPDVLERTTGYTDELFLLKMSLVTGHTQWVQTTRGYGIAYGVAVECDLQGNGVVLAGTYDQWIEFRDLPQRPRLQSNGDEDTFVAHFDASGTVQWFREIKSSYAVMAYDMARDAAGDLYLTGMYTNMASFEGGPYWHHEPSEVGQCYLLKMDAEGNYLWSQTVGSEAIGSAGTGVTTDAAGRVYLVGELTGSDWDPERNHTSDLFLHAYSAEGQMLFQQGYIELYPTTFRGTYEYSFVPNIWRVCANSLGEMAMAGPYDRCVDMNPDTGTTWVCPGGTVDTFLVQFAGKSNEDASAWSVTLDPGQTLAGIDFANYIAAPN